MKTQISNLTEKLKKKEEYIKSLILKDYYNYKSYRHYLEENIYKFLCNKYGKDIVNKYWKEITGHSIPLIKWEKAPKMVEEEEGGWEGSGGSLISLIVYYQELKAKGLTDQQILEIFLKEGWSEELLKVNWPTISGHEWKN